MTFTLLRAAGWSTVGLQVAYDEAQVQDQIVAAAGSYASSGTESSSKDTVSVLVAFKGAGTSNLPPTMSSFTASPATIVGKPSANTLSWNTARAASVTIDSGIGSVAASGSMTVTPATTTTYTLTASNTYGTVQAQTTITVTTSSPPVISNIQASGVTSSSAGISWTTDVNADSQVEYGTSTAYGLSSPLNGALVTSHSMALSGLAAATVYHYRVKSRNSSGVLAVSSDNTFTTLPAGGSAPARVQSKGAVGINANSVSATFANPTTSGNALIVAVADYYATAVFSVSDSKGNTWKTAVNYVNGAHIVVFYAENIVGGSARP